MTRLMMVLLFLLIHTCAYAFCPHSHSQNTFAFLCTSFLQSSIAVCFVPVWFLHYRIEPVYGTRPEFTWLANMTFNYHIYELTIMVFDRKMRGRHCEFLLYSFFILIHSWASYRFELLQIYSVFFFSFVEIPSLPLLVIDYLRLFSNDTSRHHHVDFFARVVFVIMFVLLRVICWFVVSLSMLLDIKWSFTNDVRSKDKIVIIGSMLLSNIFLGFMQLKWTYRIADMLKPRSKIV